MGVRPSCSPSIDGREVGRGAGVIITHARIGSRRPPAGARGGSRQDGGSGGTQDTDAIDEILSKQLHNAAARWKCLLIYVQAVCICAVVVQRYWTAVSTNGLTEVSGSSGHPYVHNIARMKDVGSKFTIIHQMAGNHRHTVGGTGYLHG